MKKIVFSFVLLTIATFGVATDLMANEKSGTEILAIVDRIRTTTEPMVMDVRMIYHDEKDGSSDEQQLEIHTKDLDRSLILYTYPPRMKGQSVLMVDNNIWIYVKGTRQPIRISARQRMLGQASTGDLAKMTFSGDYHAETMGVESVDGTDCLKLALTATNKDATYDKAELWVTKDTYRPLKANLFALSGKLLKTITYGEYRETLGEMRPMRQRIDDAIITGEYTELHYLEMRAEDTPNSNFNKDFLKHLK